MKLVFARDIPELAAKTWPERITLRSQAKERDKRIGVRTTLLTLPWALLPLLLIVLRQYEILPPPSWWVLLVYLVILLPLSVLAQALWINPLVKAALQAPSPTTRGN